MINKALFTKTLIGPLGLLLCFATSSVVAQTFYVATNGSDQPQNGSQQQPWGSISYAIDRVGDGAVIQVAEGTYNGQVRLDQQFNSGITIRSAEPYKARLRHDGGAVVICFTCQGVTFEGFDIAHSASNTGALVIQIQTTAASNVTLRNNIIHDSTNNDLLKVNNGARDVLIEGNMFYNQAGSDEHIDINSVTGVTVQDNVFFNSKPQAVTSSYIVIKDSNGNDDGVLGSSDVTVKRNVFFSWQGNTAQSFIRVGEDGTANFEADGVLIENNLMIGNSSTLMRSALTVQGSRDVRFRFNTVVGNLASRSFAARLIKADNNQANQSIVLSNNIWSDPTGTMGAEGYNGVDVFDAPSGANASVSLDNNLYYNGGSAIPIDVTQSVNLANDSHAVIGNPGLASQAGLIDPVYNGSQFSGGFSNIRQVFVSFVNQYGKPAANSIVINAASVSAVPADDVLGGNRGGSPDIGAFEVGSTLPLPPPVVGKKTALPWLLLLDE